MSFKNIIDAIWLRESRQLRKTAILQALFGIFHFSTQVISSFIIIKRYSREFRSDRTIALLQNMYSILYNSLFINRVQLLRPIYIYIYRQN